MVQLLASSAPGAVAPRRLRLWPWIVTLVVGVVAATVGFGVWLGLAVDALAAPSVRTTPFTATLQLGSGTYYVYQAGEWNGATVQPDDVVVSSAATGRLVVSAAVVGQTLTRSGVAYSAAVGFDVPQSGSYLVHVASPADTGYADVVVAPSFQTAFTRDLWLLAAGVAGIVAALVGLVLVIVRTVQRSRRRTAARALVPRCANGHPAQATDRFCATCGAPVFAPGLVGAR